MQHLYRHFDKDGNLLYVGVSLSAMQRLSQHKSASHWFPDIKSVTIEQFETREAVLEAEMKAIAEENPLHNLKRPSKREVEQYEKQTNTEESKKDLIRRVVQFNPLYSIAEVANILDVRGPGTVKRMIEDKKIGHIVIGEKQGRYGLQQTIRITGWQLIDFIENAELESSVKTNKKQRA